MDSTVKERYGFEQLVQRIKLSAKHEAIDEMRANLNNLIHFIENNEPRAQTKLFVERISKLIELAEQFNK